MDALIRSIVNFMVVGLTIMTHILNRNIQVQTYLKGRKMRTAVCQQQEKVLSGRMQKFSKCYPFYLRKNMLVKDSCSAFHC